MKKLENLHNACVHQADPQTLSLISPFFFSFLKKEEEEEQSDVEEVDEFKVSAISLRKVCQSLIYGSEFIRAILPTC